MPSFGIVCSMCVYINLSSHMQASFLGRVEGLLPLRRYPCNTPRQARGISLSFWSGTWDRGRPCLWLWEDQSLEEGLELAGNSSQMLLHQQVPQRGCQALIQS